MKYIVTLNNKTYEVEVERGQASIINTSEVAAEVVQLPNKSNASALAVQTTIPVYENGEGQQLKSPMPGTIMDVKAIQGAAVKKGDVLFILEAMKMENEITADKDGVVTQVLVAKGVSVATGHVLAVIR